MCIYVHKYPCTYTHVHIHKHHIRYVRDLFLTFTRIGLQFSDNGPGVHKNIGLFTSYHCLELVLNPNNKIPTCIIVVAFVETTAAFMHD